MNWIILLIITAVFYLTPYRRGLFFDSDLYPVEAILLGLFVIWFIGAGFRKTKNRLPAVTYLPFILPLFYLLLFFTAETPRGNLDMVLRWSSYCTFFVLMIWLRQTNWIEKVLPYAFHLCGIILALFSIFGLWGWIHYRDIMLGDRLTGPFQYANTFAAIMGAYWLYAMLSLTDRRKSVYHHIFFSLPIVLFGVDFLASYSRGALLLLPVAWFIALFLIPFKEQVSYLVLSGAALSASLIGFQFMKGHGHSLQKCLLLGLLSLVVATIHILLIRFADPVVNKLSNQPFVRKYQSILLPILVVAAGLLLLADLVKRGFVYHALPSSIQARIAQIQLSDISAVGRMHLYKDAARLAKAAPFFGYGGNGWSIAYVNEQSKPYLSNQIHSGYLDLLISSGGIGFLLWLGVFITLGIAVYKHVKAGSSRSVAAPLAALAMLLLHSFMDFDFSYGVVWFTVFWLLAMCVPFQSKGEAPTKIQRNMLLAGKGIVASLALLTSVYSIRLYFADRIVREVQQGPKSTFQDVEDKLHTAVSLQPYQVEYRLMLANLYLQAYNSSSSQKDLYRTDILKQLGKVQELEPHNANILSAIANNYVQLSDWEHAIHFMDEAILKGKFLVEYYDAAISLKTQLALHNVDAKGKEYAAGAVHDYETYLQWFNQYNGKPIPDERNILLARSGHLFAAKAYLLTGNGGGAMNILATYNPSIDPGIYNKEQKQLLTNDYDFMTLKDLFTTYKAYTILVSVRGEATSALGEENLALFDGMNSRIRSLSKGGSYVAVVKNGTVAAENMRADSDVTMDTANNTEFAQALGGASATLYSAGLTAGNASSIRIKNVEYSRNEPGMNIVILDADNKAILRTNFDTRVSDIRIFKK